MTDAEMEKPPDSSLLNPFKKPEDFLSRYPKIDPQLLDNYINGNKDEKLAALTTMLKLGIDIGDIADYESLFF